MSSKPILCLDFDGVCHSYSSGWQGADVIPDPPNPGAIEFCREAREYFDIWIVSSRCHQPGGADAIRNWLVRYGFPLRGLYVSPDGHKPAASVTLDDRALTFTGAWPSVGELLAFKPWYRREAGARAGEEPSND